MENKSTTPALYINNLVSHRAGNTNTPVTEFTNGEAIHLKWESNGTNFRVFYKGIISNNGKSRTATIYKGLLTNTTIVIEATLNGKVLYASITITIKNPTLTPVRVDTSGKETIKGRLEAKGISELNYTIVKMDADIEGSGKVSFKDGSVTNKLTVDGDSTVNNLTTMGKFSTYGKVSIFNNGRQIAADYYLGTTEIAAKTDGFVVLSIEAPEEKNKSCAARAAIYTLGRWIYVQGGNTSIFTNTTTRVLGPNPGCLSFPIAAGCKWKYWAENDKTNEVKAKTYVYWFPMGGSALRDVDDTYQIIPAEEMSDGPEPEMTHIEDFTAERMQKAEEIIQLMEAAADKTFDTGIRAELAEKLLEL